nr:zinc finger BED domain-containing protein RICESLEEPER 2-like [Ipomoea batatas]
MAVGCDGGQLRRPSAAVADGYGRMAGRLRRCVVRTEFAITNNLIIFAYYTLKYRAAFDRMANEDKLYDAYFQDNENGKKRVGPPVLNDWENVRQLVQFLKLFYDATLAFSSYKKVTSNLCFNDICTIEANLNAFSNSRDVNVSSMASEMKKKFDKYWEGLDINKLLIIASVFDPRCKMCFVTICFEKLYGKDTPKCIEMKEAVVEVLHATVSLLQILEETESMDLLAEVMKAEQTAILTKVNKIDCNVELLMDYAKKGIESSHLALSPSFAPTGSSTGRGRGREKSSGIDFVQFAGTTYPKFGDIDYFREERPKYTLNDASPIIKKQP